VIVAEHWRSDGLPGDPGRWRFHQRNSVVPILRR
jgi:hypothetical protein